MDNDDRARAVIMAVGAVHLLASLALRLGLTEDEVKAMLGKALSEIKNRTLH